MSAVIEAERLGITFQTALGPVQAVQDVSFRLAGQRLGIVGESGSGKSTVARALMGLLPGSAQVRAHRLQLDGIDLTRLSARQWTTLRGRRVGMVLQDPRYALNPVIRVGDQIAEGLRIHRGMARRAAARLALQALEEVQIREPERVARLYPHELSGGMGQRIMIAATLVSEPDVLIADEPTSALDATVARQVLMLLDELIERRRMGLLLISHNLPLVSAFCDEVLVMRAGQVVETCAADGMAQARHPYTRALMAAVPGLQPPSGAEVAKAGDAA